MSSSPDAPASKKSRTPLLVGVLVLVIAALAYDKKVSMPAVRAAFKAVEAENAKINESSELRAMTSEDVQRVLNRTPSGVEKKNSYTIERYGFMRGLPFLQHNYYAVYTPAEGGKLTFQTHATFTPDEFYLGETDKSSVGKSLAQ
ncbi:MAG: hypothetical protein MK171_02055 [Pirellulales bacterium]|nr:hypothetical protein [Pirellulales bacterium]